MLVQKLVARAGPTSICVPDMREPRRYMTNKSALVWEVSRPHVYGPYSAGKGTNHDSWLGAQPDLFRFFGLR